MSFVSYQNEMLIIVNTSLCWLYKQCFAIMLHYLYYIFTPCTICKSFSNCFVLNIPNVKITKNAKRATWKERQCFKRLALNSHRAFLKVKFWQLTVISKFESMATWRHMPIISTLLPLTQIPGSETWIQNTPPQNIQTPSHQMTPSWYI